MRIPGRQISLAAMAALGAAITMLFGAGLLSGELLQQYDARVGFEREAGELADVLGVAPGMTVGDVRAGAGQWTVYFAQQVGTAGQVFATPGPNPAHELLRTVANARVDNVSVIASEPARDQPMLPSNCCDAVILRAVFHHLVAAHAGIGQELFDSVKPGGRVAIIEYDEGTVPFRTGHGIAHATVLRTLQSAGFEPVHDIRQWPGHAYCVVVRRPATS